MVLLCFLFCVLSVVFSVCPVKDVVFSDEFVSLDKTKWILDSGASWDDIFLSCGSAGGDALTFKSDGKKASVHTTTLKCLDCIAPTEYRLRFWFVTGRAASSSSFPSCKKSSGDSVVLNIIPVDGSTGDMVKYTILEFPYDYNNNEPTFVEVEFWISRSFKLEFYSNGDSFNYAIDNITVTSGPKSDCFDHGKCDHPGGTCTCDSKFTGSNCELEMCVVDEKENRKICSDKGDCVSRLGCQCDEGWVGNNCSHPLCEVRKVVFEDFFEFRDTTKLSDDGWDLIWPGTNCGSVSGFAYTFNTKDIWNVAKMTSQKIHCDTCDLSHATEYRIKFWFVTGRIASDPSYSSCPQGKSGLDNNNN